MMKAALCFCFVALSSLSIGLSSLTRVAGDDPARFNFHNYLVGTWEVFNTLLSPSSQSVTHDVTTRSYFIFTNKTARQLHAVAYENDTHTHSISSRRSLFVEFETDSQGNRGTWRQEQGVPFVVVEEREGAPDGEEDATSSSPSSSSSPADNAKTANTESSSSSSSDDEIEDDHSSMSVSPSNMQALFNFEFDHHIMTGIAVSTGVWLEALPAALSQPSSASNKQTASSSSSSVSSATYSLVVLEPHRFTLTVCASSPSSDCVLYTWRRVLPPVQQTFFQKYGMYAMLAAFFLFQTWMKSRQSGAASYRRDEPALSATTTPTPTSTTSAGTGTVNNRGGSAKKKS